MNDDNKNQRVSIENLHFPTAELHQDEFFGETEIYRHQLDLSINLPTDSSFNKALITYQGCTKGLCYPPETQEISINKDLLSVAGKTTMQHLNKINLLQTY